MNFCRNRTGNFQFSTLMLERSGCIIPQVGQCDHVQLQHEVSPGHLEPSNGGRSVVRCEFVAVLAGWGSWLRR